MPSSSRRPTSNGRGGPPPQQQQLCPDDKEEEEGGVAGDDNSVSLSESSVAASAIERARTLLVDCPSKIRCMSAPVAEAKKVLFAMCLGLLAEEDPDDPTAI